MSTKSGDGFKRVQTKASLLTKSNNDVTPVPEFAATVFESYKKKVKSEANTKNAIMDGKITKRTVPDPIPRNKLFDIKKARHEVLRLGISGFDEDARKKAKIELAVRLGAKPPKNPYKNYKDLIRDKKEMEEKKQKEDEFWQIGKTKKGTAISSMKPTNILQRNKTPKRDSDLSLNYGTLKTKIGKKRSRRNR